MQFGFNAYKDSPRERFLRLLAALFAELEIVIDGFLKGLPKLSNGSAFS